MCCVDERRASLSCTPNQPNLDFDPLSDTDFGAHLDVWSAACAVSQQIVAAHDLDDTARPMDCEGVELQRLMLR